MSGVYIFILSVESLDFNVRIHFRELPMEYEQNFRKQIWILRNPRKPLPNSLEAKRHAEIKTGGEGIGGKEETVEIEEEKKLSKQ